MNETGQPSQEQASQLVRQWLTAQNRSLRNLAQEAGLQPSIISRFLKGETTLEASSALKLYNVMQQSMNFLDRKNFIEQMDLLPLATAFSRDAALTVDMQRPAYEVASRLMVAGFDLSKRPPYEEAIPLFRTAAEILGIGSSQAAFATVTIAQLLINLGDYHQAQKEAQRVQNSYASAIDFETKAELYRIRNWLDYYQGNYIQAEHWLDKRIQIGEEADIERLKNPHFNGRIYYDQGCQCPSKTEAAQLFQKAVRCFDESYQIHLRWGDEHNRAFDLLRKAQALQMLRQGTDAKKLRIQAHAMFEMV